MGLEYITQPQVFTAPITALQGIAGLYEAYPLLTTYQYWTSTAVVPASTFPIPGTWTMLPEPGSFIVAVGGIIQPPTEYTIDRDNRRVNFNSLVSADLEVSFTQLATHAPSSQSFNYIQSVSGNFANLSARNIVVQNLSAISLTATNLFVTNLTALSSVLNVVNISQYELSGFSVFGDVNITGNVNLTNLLSSANVRTVNLTATNAQIGSAFINGLTAITTSAQISSAIVNNLTAINAQITNLTSVNTQISSAVVTNLTGINVQLSSAVVINLTGINVTGQNITGNYDGTLQIRNDRVFTRQLPDYVRVRAATDRVIRNIFVGLSGSGYTSAPAVIISPPTETWGVSAAAVAVLSGDGVGTIRLLNGGSGYSTQPTVTLFGGGGTGATAVALVDGDPLGEREDHSGVQAGYYNTTILGSDGNLYVFGYNYWKDLGVGNVNGEAAYAVPSPTIAKFNRPSTFGSVLSGNYVPRVVKFWKSYQNTYVLDQHGALWSCGNNTYGQLGLNFPVGTTPIGVFTQIPPLLFGNQPIVDFAVNKGAPVTAPATTLVGTTCLAKTANDRLYSWGFNTNGACGVGGQGFTAGTSPSAVSLSATTGIVTPLTSVDRIFVFGDRGTGTSSFITTKEGRVLAAGRNAVGNLGTGGTTDTNCFVFSAVRINPTTELSGVKDIKAIGPGGTTTTYFLRNDNTLWATGANGAGQIGNWTNTPNVGTPFLVLSSVNLFSVGDAHTDVGTLAYVHAYLNDGTFRSWGDDTAGQLGTGPTATATLSPSAVLSAVNDINFVLPYTLTGSAGFSHPSITWEPGRVRALLGGGRQNAGILRTDGLLFTVGNNSAGQLGVGTNTAQDYFRLVPPPPANIRYAAFCGSINAAGVGAAGDQHLVVVTETGDIYGCGLGYWKQININYNHIGTDFNYSYSLTPITLLG